MLDLQIKQYFSVKEAKGDVGIEIEAEAIAGDPMAFGSDYWRIVADHSLRGTGIEYILHKPILLKEVPVALEDWQARITSCKAKFDTRSKRTSVHIHNNVQKATIREVYNMVTAYWLIEDLLSNYCGESRKGNNYCLQMKSGEDVHHQLVTGIKNKKYLSHVASDNYRYSSINFDALRKFGSLEVRTMRGVYDTGIIKDWTFALQHLLKVARKFKDPADILDFLIKQDPHTMVYRLLPKDFANTVCKMYRGDWAEDIRDNALWITSIAQARDWETNDQDKKEAEKWVTTPRPRSLVDGAIHRWEQQVNARQGIPMPVIDPLQLAQDRMNLEIPEGIDNADQHNEIFVVIDNDPMNNLEIGDR